MNKYQRNVTRFHEDLNHPIGDYCNPQIPERFELRAELIEEECKETCIALRNGDIIEAIDGLCDLIYVALGTAIEAGVDLDFAWDRVHSSNMAKRGSIKNEMGKTIKSKNWMPPDIKAAINDQISYYDFKDLY